MLLLHKWPAVGGEALCIIGEAEAIRADERHGSAGGEKLGLELRAVPTGLAEARREQDCPGDSESRGRAHDLDGRTLIDRDNDQLGDFRQLLETSEGLHAVYGPTRLVDEEYTAAETDRSEVPNHVAPRA